MITLLQFGTSKKLEFNNSKELKEMLKFCNPLVLRFYKAQIEYRKFESIEGMLKIDGMGTGVRVLLESSIVMNEPYVGLFSEKKPTPKG